MANETTSTSQAALVRTEVLMQGAIQAAKPRNVVMYQLHWDDISDADSGTVKYPVYADLGAASGGTEGTDITANTELTMATTVSVSPTEGAVFRATITETILKRRLGGRAYTSVVSALQSEDPAVLDALLAPDIQRGTAMMLQKMEADSVALLNDASTVVGPGAASTLGIADLLAALYNGMKNQPLRPPSEAKFILTPNQVNEINLEALTTSGGIGGAIWSMQANYGIANRPDDAGFESSGRVGTFLNYPVHAYDHELRLVDTGAVFGALWYGGTPTQSPRDPGLAGRVGYGVMVVEAPIQFRFEQDASLRAVEVVGSTRYGVAELFDLNGVAISSKAP
jgi:hypothetical protein